MMIATSFGLALLVTAWMFYRITGGLFKYDHTPKDADFKTRLTRVLL